MTASWLRLNSLDVTRCEGHLEDARALDAACDGVDTVFHMAFKVSVGGGTAQFEEMKRINLEGTRRLLDTAAAKGVARAVVASSALAIGVNRRPEPLDETASWSEHGIDLPYAIMRRQVEQEALAMTRPGFAVVAVCPSFTMGPDDPVGAPANTLLKTLINGKQRFSLSVGVGCLDVRDFANGAVRAARARASRTAVSDQRPQRHREPAARAGRRGRGGSCAAIHSTAGAAQRSRRRRRDLQSPQAQITARDQGCSAGHRALRLVRHVAGARRPGMGAATAPADARRDGSLAAGSAMSLEIPRDPRGVDRCI